MRHCLIMLCAGLAACGAGGSIPPDMLRPCAGWQGPAPATEGQLLRAALAEKAGRECANGRLAGVAAIIGGNHAAAD